jgi:uroporphyrinogen decarboxylase
MNKIERIDNVLNGQPVDRPPLSMWYHFGVQHGSGEQFARISLEYFHHYDLDFLKVMNDYFYPPPEGIETIKSAGDLKRLQPFDIDQTVWQEQFKALKVIRQDLDQKAYFIDTVFDPWQSIKRNMAGETIQDLMDRYPDDLLAALDIVADNLIAYCQRSLELGSAGIFLSIAAASEILSREDFLKFVKPPAMKVFKAINGLGKMNTVHVHGKNLFFEDCIDFPVDIFSWWDRGPNGPSLASVKEKVSACVMGGIDQTIVSRNSPGFLKKHVKEGCRLGGDRRFLLAGGCSIDGWAYPGSLKAIVEAARNIDNT